MCKQRLFVDLLPLARSHAWDLTSLSAATGCGVQCGLCLPYLQAMLRDGTTTFHEILSLRDDTAGPS